jgi:hypothetical protein
VAVIIAGLFVASAVAVIVAKGGYSNGFSMDSLDEVQSVVSYSEKQKEHMDAKAKCKPGTQEFESKTSALPAVEGAVEKAIALIKAARGDCSLGEMAFPLLAESFLNGETEHTHFVHAMHKFDSACKSETYKLHFHIGKGKGTSFVTQVNHNLDSGAWKMLESNPPACQISTGAASAPEFMPNDSKLVGDAARFTVAELSNQQKTKGCLPKAADAGYKVVSVKQAAAVVIQGLKFALKLEVKAGAETPKILVVDVFLVCGKYKQCYFQLSIPSGSICHPFEGDPKRMLAELSQVGALPDDPTELMVAERELFEPRKLGGARAPLVKRYIKTGSVPAAFDPRGHQCYQKVTVYNQGTCGSCYAQGTGQMSGIRKCLFDMGGNGKGRRLEDAQEGEDSEENVSDLGEVADPAEGDEAEGNAELPEDGSADDTIAEESASAPEEPSATPRKLGDSDSCIAAAWGKSYNCANSRTYCESYATQMGKCCSDTCADKCIEKKWGNGWTCKTGLKYCEGAHSADMNACCGSLCKAAKTPCQCSGPVKKASDGDYCDLKPEKCSLKSGTIGQWPSAKCSAVSCPAGCGDSTSWSAFGKGNYKCPFFAKNDPGCKKFKDYGQQTNCKKTCGKCPKTDDNGNVKKTKSTNPWDGAWYKYMPSVNQLAQCANQGPGKEADGCEGGNIQGVWNNWMRSYTNELWVMGASCMPYKWKCKTSHGVVNPASGGQCSKYTKYQLWHKPCSCIPASVRPTAYRCPTSAPNSGCGFPVPPAAFLVQHHGQGLSIRDAVLNMQRHMLEFGPLQISFMCTSGFQRHDWKTNPVYTGGGSGSGGHVVNGVGWGHGHGVDYWILRNSWAATWADHGYCKFKRGVNLDQVESRGVSVTMPTTTFKDWSPPSCDLQKWSWTTWSRGNVLTKLPYTFKFKCTKKATMKVFVSNRLTDRKAIETGVSGNNYNKQCPGAGVEVPLEVEMAGKDFGIKAGMAWIQVTSDDGKGNSAKSSSFVDIAASGMTSYSPR